MVTGWSSGGSTGAFTAPGTNRTSAQAVQGINGGVPLATTETGSSAASAGIRPVKVNGGTALQAKGSRGNLYRLEVGNNTATAGYIVEYNSATTPAAGTLTNSLVLGCHILPASDSYEPARNPSPPKPFSAGIQLLVSSTSCSGTTIAYAAGIVTAMIEGEAR